jgi:hypothetical protein
MTWQGEVRPRDTRRGARREVLGVAILDGLGLLLFIVPGVIAFAVDFSNGTIYLPRGSHRRGLDVKDLRQIGFDPAASRAELETILEKETGVAVKLDDPALQVSELKSVHELMVRFVEAPHERLLSFR